MIDKSLNLGTFVAEAHHLLGIVSDDVLDPEAEELIDFLLSLLCFEIFFRFGFVLFQESHFEFVHLRLLFFLWVQRVLEFLNLSFELLHVRSRLRGVLVKQWTFAAENSFQVSEKVSHERILSRHHANLQKPQIQHERYPRPTNINTIHNT